jgi:cytosine/adenosine deaminase-related metal-dependent hydrolase
VTESHEKTLIAGGAVLTVDDDRRVLDPGAIVTEGDRIVAVDDRDTIIEEHTVDRTISLEGSVILPGLVDSHGHAGHALTKGLGVDGEGGWMNAVQDVYFHASTEEFWEVESYLAALEHLEMGVTTSLSYPGSSSRVDDPKYAIAAATGYEELGLRHVVNIGPPNPPYPNTYTDVSTGETVEVDLDGAIETTEAVIDALDGNADGRLSVSVGPSALVPEVVQDGETRLAGIGAQGSIEPDSLEASDRSVEQLEKVLGLAREKDVNIQAHAYGGQVRAAVDSVPEILGPELSLAHCAGLTHDEVDIMAEHDVSASHGPLTHAYASARFPLVEALDAGVNVAVSTDGAAPDRSFDLLSQGRIAAQLQRAHFNDTALLPHGKILEMMTIDAARALGMADEVGSLEAGKKADIIAVDLDTAKLRPRTALAHRVVHYASGNDTEFVMTDGNVLVRDREFEGPVADALPSETGESVLTRADEVARETFERAGLSDALEPHPNAWNAVRY